MGAEADTVDGGRSETLFRPVGLKPSQVPPAVIRWQYQRQPTNPGHRWVGLVQTQSATDDPRMATTDNCISQRVAEQQHR